MRVWLIGADQLGMTALRQLQKSPTIEVVITDAMERPRAVTEGLVPRIDHVEVVNSTNIGTLGRRIRPDLILIDRGAIQRSLRRVSGGAAFVESLLSEMASASEFPTLIL